MVVFNGILGVAFEGRYINRRALPVYIYTVYIYIYIYMYLPLPLQLCYSWETGRFGPCSASCGGGDRVRPVRCVQTQGAGVVDVPSAECPSDSAPDSVETCNLQHCPARYL